MPTILIVDDDEIDREAARRCLRPLKGLRMLFAKEGNEALQLVARRRPDVVVTDLRMPGMDGLELVEELQEEYSQLPVVLVTSRGSEQIAVKALKAGAASYVPKRELKKYLLQTIRQLLDVAKAAKKQSEVLKYLSQTETQFEIASDLSLIAPVASYFQDNLKRIGFGTETTRTQMGIAIMEALSNAILHGNLELDSDLRRADPEGYDELAKKRRKKNPYVHRRVYFRALESKDRVEYTVRDEGPGFDLATLPDRQASGLLDIAGRGVMLMRSFMDVVEYNRLGNEVTMVKNGG